MSAIEPKQELISVIEEQLDDPEITKHDAMYCHFALGNLLHAARSFDPAFENYLAANALQRESFSYDADETRQFVDRFIEVYNRDYFGRNRSFGSTSCLPVFIVGMPRSGTTLIEQIVSSHPSAHGAGEIEAVAGIYRSIAHRLGFAEPEPECMSVLNKEMIEEYSARYLRDLTLHCPSAARITDKFPQNFFAIGLIKTLFPDARIVHCQRNSLDNCTSLFFHCFNTFKATFELTELGQYYRQYQRLLSHWEDLFPGEILTVQYEDLVMNQESVSKQLIEYIGLEWDENCMEFQNSDRNTSSPSNVQVRQPIYETSINRWKDYERQLQPLIEVLQQANQDHS
jgi:hypothetical protein